MNFQQLRILREAARCDCNLTEVATRLHTSQSGVSKHIKDLEQELGIEIFSRRGKRLTGFTEPGTELLAFVERILLDTQNIRNVAANYGKRARGELTIATTHTQARYALPRVVAEFRELYPKVHLRITQASPRAIVEGLRRGDADIGIATELLKHTPELASFAFHRWYHCVIVPHHHPLTQLTALSLADIANYPLITYQEGYSGRAKLDACFHNDGLEPEVTTSALDADVIKTYVELGIGVGIIAGPAYSPQRDLTLTALDCRHLFPEMITRVAVMRGCTLRDYAYDFIRLCIPGLRDSVIKMAQSHPAHLAASGDEPTSEKV